MGFPRGTIERSLHLPKNFPSDADGHDDDDTIAKRLFKKIRIVCWIMTTPDNLQERAIHVQRTWAKRCNVILYMSSAANSSFPAVGLDVLEGRQHLTEKTMKAFKYVYDNYKDLGDWFLKADDDTYVIMENLRYLLSDENPNEAVYFGMRFRPHVRTGVPQWRWRLRPEQRSFTQIWC
ncbi:Glycoprotein-N-acetylgalactosamine 3-beta-galactosyltransferase 1 [Bulinus truncatus]|nr:Glycoprotein-N-acetylgalactosamine 3-beta-galactosyltransferase 1 [Bulinus truncatus]